MIIFCHTLTFVDRTPIRQHRPFYRSTPPRRFSSRRIPSGGWGRLTKPLATGRVAAGNGISSHRLAGHSRLYFNVIGIENVGHTEDEGGGGVHHVWFILSCAYFRAC